MTWLDDDVVTAVQRHMGEDHAAETLVMARSVEPETIAAVVQTLDVRTITLRATQPDGTDRLIVLEWPSELAERADIRHQVVVLYEACLPPAL